MKNIICINENDSMLNVYALYSFLNKNKIILYGKKESGIRNYFSKKLSIKQDDIGTYYGKWYEIQKYMVCESKYLKKLKIENSLLIKLQSKIFKSHKVINYYKQYFSNIEYKLLRDKILATRLEGPYIFLFPYLHSYRILAEYHLNKNEYTYSRILTLMFVIYSVHRFTISILKTLIVKPVFVKKCSGIVLKNIAWDFGGKGLKDDMLIDGRRISKNDFIYYYWENSKKKNIERIVDNATNNGYKVLAIGRNINMNVCYYLAIRNNFIYATILLLRTLIQAPYLLNAIQNFNSKTFSNYKLFSFVNVKLFWSVGNWHDITETIVSNSQNVRSFMYSWSDYAQSYLYPFIYTVHDDVFMWGSIEKEYTMHKSLHDNMYVIGCIFSNNYIEPNKSKIFANLNLSANKPVVVFYDSPVNNSMRYPQSLFDQFRDIIMFVEKKYNNIQIILKPKTVTVEYKEYFKNTSVKLYDSRDIYLGDVLNISTLNVGMGIVAPITISLFMNKPGIFFDTAGNYDSPFAKYEGDLVFRDQESLLNKIDQILTCKLNPPEIKELIYFNVPDSDPVAILRDYIITGVVEEKYRLSVD